MPSQVVGYWYSFSILAGLCRGPVNEVIEVKAGDRTIWSGTADENEVVTINAPNVFGGEEKEGGVSGPLMIMMGATNQEPEDGRASATLTFGGQPSIGDTVTVGDATFTFTAYVESPSDGGGNSTPTDVEGGGGSDSGGGGDEGGEGG